MIKMRALRPFTSTVHGNLSQGDVFMVSPGYADQFEQHGMASRIVSAPAPKAPAPKNEAEAAIAALKATIEK